MSHGIGTPTRIRHGRGGRGGEDLEDTQGRGSDLRLIMGRDGIDGLGTEHPTSAAPRRGKSGPRGFARRDGDAAEKSWDRSRAGLASVDPENRGPADRPDDRSQPGGRPESRAQRRAHAHPGGGRPQAARSGLFPAVDQSRHELRFAYGHLQQSSGNILSVNRSAVYVGAGSNAVAAGTVNIPGVFLAENIGQGIFAYLASKQTVRQREFATIAVRNQVFLQVTWAYSELLRAEGRRAAQIQARDEARLIAKLTSDYAKAGQGREADANRAATQLARREGYIQAAEGEILTASANLCRILNLDPSIRLHPTDAFVVPHPLVPDPIPVAELIALGLLNRPELAAQRAAIQAALMNLDGAKILPFSPTTIVGFSAGGFAGGSNLVRPIFGGMSGRDDLDAIMYWTIQNLGVGNIALIRLADAQLKVTQFQQIEILNRVRADVAEAYARTHARYAQIGTYEEAVRSGYLAYHEDLDRTLSMGGDRPRDVLPIELLNSFDLLANARVEYVDAIVDYNRAQFAMYVALGQPPANRWHIRSPSTASCLVTFPLPEACRGWHRRPPMAHRRPLLLVRNLPAPLVGAAPSASPTTGGVGIKAVGLTRPIPPPRHFANGPNDTTN